MSKGRETAGKLRGKKNYGGSVRRSILNLSAACHQNIRCFASQRFVEVILLISVKTRRNSYHSSLGVSNPRELKCQIFVSLGISVTLGLLSVRGWETLKRAGFCCFSSFEAGRQADLLWQIPNFSQNVLNPI